MTWSQPILDNVATGVVGLLVTRRGDRTFFLMQAKAEAGNRNMVQMAPTVQFTSENYAHGAKLRRPFLFEEFRNPGEGFLKVWENMQAEEGGRFYKAQNIHRILMLREGRTLSAPPEFRWLTLGQLRFFLHMGNTVNSCARSILACLI
jgi:oxidase EvaA